MDSKPFTRADDQIRFEPVGPDTPPTPWVAYVTGLAMGAITGAVLMWVLSSPAPRWVVSGHRADAWRLDTRTGAIELCIAGQTACTPMPMRATKPDPYAAYGTPVPAAR